MRYDWIFLRKGPSKPYCNYIRQLRGFSSAITNVSMIKKEDALAHSSKSRPYGSFVRIAYFQKALYRRRLSCWISWVREWVSTTCGLGLECPSAVASSWWPWIYSCTAGWPTTSIPCYRVRSLNVDINLSNLNNWAEIESKSGVSKFFLIWIGITAESCSRSLFLSVIPQLKLEKRTLDSHLFCSQRLNYCVCSWKRYM